MDPLQFDRFARTLAGTTRRSLLKVAFGAIVGGVSGAIGLGQAEAAQVSRAPGEICTKNGNCASGLCGPKDRTGRSRCLCVNATDCPQPSASDACRSVTCSEVGICGTAINVGASCGGGDRCTLNPICQENGSCAGTPKNCDDNNACTTDTCNPSTGCVHTPISCDDGNVCTIDTCDPSTGCVHTPISCDDNNACTTDTCDPGTGCVNTPVNCDDNNACTVDTCDPNTGCVHTPIVCNDNNACSVDTCNPQTGTCIFTPTACNECTTVTDCPDGSLCQHGGCFPITVAFGPDCDARCEGSASVAILNGSFVCVGSISLGSLPCSTDVDCPLGWACFSNVYCVPPC